MIFSPHFSGTFRWRIKSSLTLHVIGRFLISRISGVCGAIRAVFASKFSEFHTLSSDDEEGRGCNVFRPGTTIESFAMIETRFFYFPWTVSINIQFGVSHSGNAKLKNPYPSRCLRIHFVNSAVHQTHPGFHAGKLLIFFESDRISQT